MDDLFEGVGEVVLELVVGVLDAVSDYVFYANIFGGVSKDHKNKKVNPKEDNLTQVIRTEGRDTYITALIATAVTLSYVDDGKLDKHEKKMIQELVNHHELDLSKSAKKNIKYVRRHKMSEFKLMKLYERLNVKDQTVLKIIDDMNSLLQFGKKDVSKQKRFLNVLKKQITKTEQTA